MPGGYKELIHVHVCSYSEQYDCTLMAIVIHSPHFRGQVYPIILITILAVVCSYTARYTYMYM